MSFSISYFWLPVETQFKLKFQHISFSPGSLEIKDKNIMNDTNVVDVAFIVFLNGICHKYKSTRVLSRIPFSD